MELGLDVDKTISIKDFDKVLELLGETSKNHKLFDTVDMSLKFFDETKRPIFKFTSTNGSSMNSGVLKLRNAIRNKFNLDRR